MTAVRTALIAMVAAGVLLAANAAHARSAYCSDSGDLCYRAVAKGSEVYLRIGIAARYFRSYRLCVTPPRGPRECERFAIRRRGSAYGSTVRWRLHFANRGRGTYRVTWHAPARLGPSVSFRR